MIGGSTSSFSKSQSSVYAKSQWSQEDSSNTSQSNNQNNKHSTNDSSSSDAGQGYSRLSTNPEFWKSGQFSNSYSTVSAFATASAEISVTSTTSFTCRKAVASVQSLSTSIATSASKIEIGVSSRSAQADISRFLSVIQTRDTAKTINNIDRQFGTVANSIENGPSKAGIDQSMLKTLFDALTKIAQLLESLVKMTRAQTTPTSSNGSASNGADINLKPLFKEICAKLTKLDGKAGDGEAQPGPDMQTQRDDNSSARSAPGSISASAISSASASASAIASSSNSAPVSSKHFGTEPVTTGPANTGSVNSDTSSVQANARAGKYGNIAQRIHFADDYVHTSAADSFLNTLDKHNHQNFKYYMDAGWCLKRIDGGHTTVWTKDGQEKTTRSPIAFDTNGDGSLDTIEWMSGDGDSLLVDDRDGKAAGDMSGARLFGDQGGRFTDGYQKLAQLDTNGDNQLSGTELRGLKLWNDNGNAKVDDGELVSAQDAGITRISTQRNDVHNDKGETLMRSNAEVNGREMMTEDVWFGHND